MSLQNKEGKERNPRQNDQTHHTAQPQPRIPWPAISRFTNTATNPFGLEYLLTSEATPLRSEVNRVKRANSSTRIQYLTLSSRHFTSRHLSRPLLFPFPQYVWHFAGIDVVYETD